MASSRYGDLRNSFVSTPQRAHWNLYAMSRTFTRATWKKFATLSKWVIKLSFLAPFFDGGGVLLNEQ